MLNLIERKLATVTPKEAAAILEERNTYVGQRPLRQTHVNYLAGKMREGLFHSAEIAYAKLPDGRWITVNGQHTCAAAVQSGMPFNASIYGYECQTENDVFALYAEIDRGMRRSQTDITRAGRQIMPASLREINAQCVGQYGAAILMAPAEGRPAEFRSREITPQSRVAAVCAHQDEALFLDSYRNGMLLNLVAARMAMVATFRVGGERARRFWDGVVAPDGLPATDPRRLLSHGLQAKDTRRSAAMSVHRTYSMCIGHWNAHATGAAVAAYQIGRAPEALKPTAPMPALATVTNPRPAPLAPAAFPILRAAPAAAGTSAHA